MCLFQWLRLSGAYSVPCDKQDADCPLSQSLASVTMRALFIRQPLNIQEFTHSFMLGCPLSYMGDQAGEWKT